MDSLDDLPQETDLSVKSAEHAKATYDRVAGAYDDLWSKHVAEPNEQLTRDLRLVRGERIADLACGTGLFTLDMARAVSPGEVVCVDYSEGMLAAARERFAAAGFDASLVHQKAEDFVESCDEGSFDAVSMRFALAYLDWRAVLPRMSRMVRPGGRVAIMTSLASSMPQAAAVYHKLLEAFGAILPVTMPEAPDDVAAKLAEGGLAAEASWSWRLRLWFESGVQAAAWLRESGYASHPSLASASPEALAGLEALFAAGLDDFREAPGIPIDIVVGAAIARKK